MIFYKEAKEDLPTVLCSGGAIVATFTRTADGKRFEFDCDDAETEAVLISAGYHYDKPKRKAKKEDKKEAKT